MASIRMTIPERKQAQLERFNNDYIKDIDKAKYIVNSYNRLCGLCDRLLYLENDERFYNNRYTLELENKQERWIKRLDACLKSYGLNLVWSGHIPSIGIKENDSNCIKSVVFWWITR